MTSSKNNAGSQINANELLASFRRETEAERLADRKLIVAQRCREHGLATGKDYYVTHADNLEAQAMQLLELV